MQYLIDASVYVFRAYYSMPEDMVDGDGHPVNATYGFCRFLGDFMEQVRPAHIAVAFDESLSTSFRNAIYPAYKANREPAPEELKRQFAQCRRFVQALGLMLCADSRYEADDLIGTLVFHGRALGRPSTIVSRDKDLTQLLTEVDFFWDFAGKGKLGYAHIPANFGVRAEQIADFLALAGDRSTTSRACPASARRRRARCSRLSPRSTTLREPRPHPRVAMRGAKTLAAKLALHREAALLARRLTGLACDAPIVEPESWLRPRRPDLGRLNALYDETGFGPALRRQAERLADLHTA